MCGLPYETETDGCQTGIFKSKEGHQLDGIFCECGNDGCNHSSKLSPLDKVYIVVILYIYLICYPN